MMEKCYLEVVSFLEPVLCQYEWSNFEYYWRISMDRLFGISQKTREFQENRNSYKNDNKDNKRVLEYCKELLEKLIYYQWEFKSEWMGKLDENKLNKTIVDEGVLDKQKLNENILD